MDDRDAHEAAIRKIARKNIAFEPLHGDIVKGIESAVKKHHPRAKVFFGECRHCAWLHGRVLKKDAHGNISLAFDFTVEPDGWHKKN